MRCWVGGERISEIVSLISGYGSFKEEVHENVCWGTRISRSLSDCMIPPAGHLCFLCVAAERGYTLNLKAGDLVEIIEKRRGICIY